MKLAITILMVVLCPLVLAATAGAVTITVDSVTQFDNDGFENDVVGATPSATTVGSWSTGGSVSVWDGNSGGPGAFEGDNYLMIYKPANSGSYNAYAFADMDGDPLTSGTIIAEHGVYLATSATAATSYRISFGGSTDFQQRHSRLAFDSANLSGVTPPTGFYAVGNHNDSGYEVATIKGTTDHLFVPADQWVTLRHTLNYGVDITITVDGVESNPMAIGSAYATNPVMGLVYAMGSTDLAGQFYVDGGDSGPPPPRIPGDANGDRVVNDEDASILAAHWQQTGVWGDGDFNEDGVVNDQDAAIMAAHWGETGEGDAAPVPEPGTLILLAGALLSLLVWRRR